MSGHPLTIQSQRIWAGIRSACIAGVITQSSQKVAQGVSYLQSRGICELETGQPRARGHSVSTGFYLPHTTEFLPRIPGRVGRVQS